MEIIGDNSCYTSLKPKGKVVYCSGEARTYSLELQFVDENNKPVTGLKVYLEYHSLATEAEVALSRLHGCNYNPTPPPNPAAEITDSQGWVKFNDLNWIAVDVKTDGQQLADQMAQRPLSIRRNPNSQPVSKNAFRRETRDKSWRTDVQVEAEAAGYVHHYVMIGELCNQLPQIEGWLESEPPEFHFPHGREMKGTEIKREELDKIHVIEVCPFRAWILALQDTKEYDPANALNLGIMADLVYSAEAENPAIDYFFRQKCLDLSAMPQFAEFPSYFHTLAVDVPFNDRYQAPVYLNTGEGPSGEGDTRLFTVECGQHLLVAWCGTDSLLNVLTDLSFAPKPVPTKLIESGKIHGGFLEAYELAKHKFGDQLSTVRDVIARGNKRLFICGHSLGGALALIYAAEMKVSQPLLYTFGMPRCFTRSAMRLLENITHYRHVNDNDSVTQIPPDADLDNILYQRWGELGDKLGFDWAFTTLIGIQVAVKDLSYQAIGFMEKKDPYWHHGNTVIFFQAQQCVMKSRRQNVPWIGGGGYENPYPGEIYYRETAAVKLYLVPSLNDQCRKSSGDAQAAFVECLEPTSLERIFPKNSNPTLDGFPTDPRNHSMAHRYLPFIHNQILELAGPSRTMVRMTKRSQFSAEVESALSNRANPFEVQRNRDFLALQAMLPITLQLINSAEIGRNALKRFAAVTEEEIELSL